MSLEVLIDNDTLLQGLERKADELPEQLRELTNTVAFVVDKAVKEEAPVITGNLQGSISIDNVRSSYAIGKKMSELFCKSYTEEFNLDCVVVRPGHIFGPTASPNDKRISSEFAYLSAKKKDLYMKSSGSQKRSYCYSLDCAKAILIVLIKGKSGEAYNIGHDEVTTIKQMATFMADAGNVRIKIENPSHDDLTLFGRGLDIAWHMFLPVFCYVLGSFASMTVLMKNSLM